MSAVLEVFLVALRLGLTTWGGPFVHLARFRTEYVERRGWIDADRFAQLLAVCQLLPGPTSSQLGFALGRHRAGFWGGWAAWLGFTLPSAVIMAGLAGFGSWGFSLPSGPVKGLTAGAWAVVAVASWSMARSLATTPWRIGLALVAAVTSVVWPTVLAPVVILVVAAVVGAFEPGITTASSTPLATRTPIRAPWIPLVVLVAGLVALPWVGGPLGTLASSFFRAGALVFGGGHVVLPALAAHLAQAGLPASQIGTGYALAQLMPGPLFSVAAYWGWLWAGPFGAVLGLAALFAPGLLLVMVATPWVGRWSPHGKVARAAAGVSAAVVGLLVAVLVRPLGIDLASTPAALVLALALAALHGAAKVPAPLVVMLGAGVGLFL